MFPVLGNREIWISLLIVGGLVLSILPVIPMIYFIFTDSIRWQGENGQADFWATYIGISKVSIGILLGVGSFNYVLYRNECKRTIWRWQRTALRSAFIFHFFTVVGLPLCFFSLGG